MPDALRPPAPRPRTIDERFAAIERDIAALKAYRRGEANNELTAVQLANQALDELRVIRAQIILDTTRSSGMGDYISKAEAMKLIAEAEERAVLKATTTNRPPADSTVGYLVDEGKKGWRRISPELREVVVRRVMQAVSVAILALTAWIAANMPAAKPALVSPASIIINDAGAP